MNAIISGIKTIAERYKYGSGFEFVRTDSDGRHNIKEEISRFLDTIGAIYKIDIADIGVDHSCFIVAWEQDDDIEIFTLKIRWL